jgi:replicative DNA helicase
LITDPSVQRQGRQFEVAKVTRDLKELAKDLQIPIVALVQLNREVAHRSDKTPQLTDLRESGEIEQSADVVIMLHRPDYYDPETPRAGECDLIVRKNRGGPTDTVTVASQLHLSRFVDMAV